MMDTFFLGTPRPMTGDSIRIRCHLCGADVWLHGPVKAVYEREGGKGLCGPCFFSRMQRQEYELKVLPEQEEELRRMGFDPEVVKAKLSFLRWLSMTAPFNTEGS